MSSFLAVELDALNKAPAAARAARVSEDVVIGGLLRMWAHCFREKVGELEPLQVAGFFSAEADMVPALLAFGFLARTDGVTVRVKGAERYLRISEGRSKGGRAASGNLRRGNKPSRAEFPGSLPAEAGHKPEQTPGSTPGFHRTPNTEHLEERNVRTSDLDDAVTLDMRRPPVNANVEQPKKRRACAIIDATAEPEAEPVPVVSGPIVYAKPTLDPELWSSAEEFWAWAQARRQEAGLIGERERPRGLSAWWSVARQTTSAASLLASFEGFMREEHWQKATPANPFRGFLKQWDRWVPRQAPKPQPRVDADVFAELRSRARELGAGGHVAEQLEQLRWERKGTGYVGVTEDGYHAQFIVEKFGPLLADLGATIDAPAVGGAA